MGAYSRGGRLLERGAYLITSPLGWALIRGGLLFEGSACSRHYGTVQMPGAILLENQPL